MLLLLCSRNIWAITSVQKLVECHIGVHYTPTNKVYALRHQVKFVADNILCCFCVPLLLFFCLFCFVLFFFFRENKSRDFT